MSRTEIQDVASRAFSDAGLAAEAAITWPLMAELGLFMLPVPEAQGGLGLGLEAIGAVQTELGRALVRGPAIAQMLVIDALAQTGEEALLARAMIGEAMTACLSGHGDLTAVPDADTASYILHVAPERISLIDSRASGVSVSPQGMWDETRRLFAVSVADAAPAHILAEGAPATRLADRLSSLLSLSLAADSLGGAEALLVRTIDYLTTRHQFDRPLALFQALKHRVADLKIKITTAQALFWARANDDRTTALEMGALKTYAAQVYMDVAEDSVQLHGGIGLTSEYYCHLFLKRAMLNGTLGGDGDYWREAVGRARLNMRP